MPVLFRYNDMAREFTNGFYKTREWKQCRADFMKSRRYLCENCLAKGIYTPGVIVHHIEELPPMNIDKPEVTLSFDNLRLVCRKCHAEEHKAGKDRRYLFGENGEIVVK